jgi:cytochrome c-type biogenesis protein CcmH
VTAFVVASAAMLAAALLWLLLPFWRATDPQAEAIGKRDRRTSTVLVSVLVPAIAIGMYATLSSWDWKASDQQLDQAAQMDDLLAQLEARLQQNPQDIDGWLLLGRSNASMGRYPQALDAYQHAYDLSKGENLDAMLGLGEALFLTDETSLGGRAGQLFEAALARAPQHPKALWYGSVAALQAGDLRTGRDRLQGLLSQNPPPELQAILQRQIEDLNAQLGEAGEGEATPAQGNSSTARTIQVAVSVTPEIQRQVSGDTPLFVLARDPNGGPPLAVQRHTSAQLPLTLTLSERDAMMPSRTISSVSQVQVVARLARNGTPQAQSGDFFGESSYDFGKHTGTLNIIINSEVP